MQSSKQGMSKRYHLSIEGIQKGYLFVKNGIWKGKGLDLGAEPPCINICWVPPPPPLLLLPEPVGQQICFICLRTIWVSDKRQWTYLRSLMHSCVVAIALFIIWVEDSMSAIFFSIISDFHVIWSRRFVSSMVSFCNNTRGTNSDALL